MSQHTRTSVTSISTTAKFFEHDTILLGPLRFLAKYGPQAVAAKIAAPAFDLIISHQLFYNHAFKLLDITLSAEPFFELFGSVIPIAMMKATKFRFEERMALNQLGAARMMGNYGVILSCLVSLLPCILMCIFINSLKNFFDVENGFIYMILSLGIAPISRCISTALSTMFQTSHMILYEAAINVTLSAIHLLAIYFTLFIEATNGKIFMFTQLMMYLAVFKLCLYWVNAFASIATFYFKRSIFSLNLKYFSPFRWHVVGKILSHFWVRLIEVAAEPLFTVLILFRFSQYNLTNPVITQQQRTIFLLYRQLSFVAGAFSSGICVQVSELFKVLKANPQKIRQFMNQTSLVCLGIQTLISVAFYCFFAGGTKTFFATTVKIPSADLFASIQSELRNAAFLGILHYLIGLGTAFNDALRNPKMILMQQLFSALIVIAFGVGIFLSPDTDLTFSYNFFILSQAFVSLCISLFYFFTVDLRNPIRAFDKLQVKIDGKDVDELDFKLGEDDRGLDGDDALEMNMELETLDFPEDFFNKGQNEAGAAGTAGEAKLNQRVDIKDEKLGSEDQNGPLKKDASNVLQNSTILSGRTGTQVTEPETTEALKGDSGDL